MPPLLLDPLFYAVAIPSVILAGLSKGGLGGAMGFVGVPLMALAMSPLQAAAILLPILVVMDVVGLWSWRGYFDRDLLLATLPGAMVGIGIGWAAAAVVTPDMVRMMVGLIALLFVGRWALEWLVGAPLRVARPNKVAGGLWGTVAGFTTFVAHIGGPPFQIYAVPLRLEPKVFTGSAVIFFAVTNAVKLVPYFALGQFDATNLMASAVLMPLAPVSTLAGAWVVRRLKPDAFYLITYATVGLIAVKLVYDGIAMLLAA